jgi:hypothetical protein
MPVEEKIGFNDASLMRGLKTRLKGFWCDTMPGTKAVSSMGLPGSSASVKDHSTKAAAIYIDLKVAHALRQKYSFGLTVDSPVSNMQSRACTDISSVKPKRKKKIHTVFQSRM